MYNHYHMVEVIYGDLLSVKETAVLAEVPEKTVRHAVEAGFVASPGFHPAPPRFTADAVLFFRVIDSVKLGIDLPVESKRDLFLAITGGSGNTWRREGATVVADIASVRTVFELAVIEKAVRHRVDVYREGLRRMESRDDVLGGEPVFIGTRIPVRHVGALVLRGIDVRELREDYPRLRASDFEFASIFTELGPSPGRPKATRLRFRRVPRRK